MNPTSSISKATGSGLGTDNHFGGRSQSTVAWFVAKLTFRDPLCLKSFEAAHSWLPVLPTGILDHRGHRPHMFDEWCKRKRKLSPEQPKKRWKSCHNQNPNRYQSCDSGHQTIKTLTEFRSPRMFPDSEHRGTLRFIFSYRSNDLTSKHSWQSWLITLNWQSSGFVNLTAFKSVYFYQDTA